MVYEWEPHRQTCYRLYVEESKSLEDVMVIMCEQHGFQPSRRAFQAQFRKWDFPTKYKPAFKNTTLVARVRELWEQNISHKEMLRVLVEEDGFQIGERELARVRHKHGLRLRDPGGFGVFRNQPSASLAAAAASQHGVKQTRIAEQEETADSADETGSSLEEEDSGSEDSEGDGAPAAGDYGAPAEQVPVIFAHDPVAEDIDPETAARREQRKRALEAESLQKWAAKKRRRRTKEWAGLPADPPGPPRFPSETTLDEAKAILQLDAEAYRMMRQKFQTLCEAADVLKKTLAGPEKWEALKEQLVRENMHLRAIMWDQQNMEKKRLAIDVIAGDVTKRLRVASNFMTLAAAKTELGLNPAQGREIRGSLYKLLAEAKFTAKSEEGQEHWAEIKRKWIASSKILEEQTALAETDPTQRLRMKAIELLAKDTLRRYRGDVKRKAKKLEAPAPEPGTIKAVPTRAAKQASPMTPKKRQLRPLAPSSQRRLRLVQPSPAPIRPLHSESRLLPAALMDSPPHQPDLASMNAQLGSALLLGAESQHPFVNEQYHVPGYAHTTPGQLAAVYQQQQHQHQHHHHHHHQQPTPTSTIAVYFRLHQTSVVPVVTASMWIATLSSGSSIDELRARAVEKYPGSLCLAVQGVIKDGKGGEIPLPVTDDAELDAYLQHAQSTGAPTFSVQLVLGGQRDWV
ncbi:hypothetical protein B0H63DRAFT_28926 [Podospora didyma]|uniref:Clr5 domain-containing protein n=1 Tax=Podospora didyma TaxID=330526 RepID=A0AAE0P5S2_9PEZI|nr:hypothetical protein B0H63DRAFT_28926 [Podospora didyma]